MGLFASARCILLLIILHFLIWHLIVSERPFFFCTFRIRLKPNLNSLGNFSKVKRVGVQSVWELSYCSEGMIKLQWIATICKTSYQIIFPFFPPISFKGCDFVRKMYNGKSPSVFFFPPVLSFDHLVLSGSPADNTAKVIRCSHEGWAD